MERHMFSVKPDLVGWILAENDEPIDWFKTRQGAVAFGDLKAYATFQFAGIPSALTVFMDDTVSITEARYG
jgi:hypothetical protein